MSVLNDPKQASRALIALGSVTLGLSASCAQSTDTPLPVIGAYVGFVMLIRGLWLAWKVRRS